MHVDKDDVVELLRSRGEHDKAASVECALPKMVDTEADAGLLAQYDLNVSEITASVHGSSAPPAPLAGPSA